MNRTTKQKSMTMKKLVDSSYLPLNVLHQIWEDRKLLEFSHMLPHWFQRRVLEIKYVFSVNIVGLSGKKEHNSGIYVRVFLDDTHQVVVCVHKYHLRFIDIQVAVRTYKSLKAIVDDLEVHSHISVINGMDFCVDLPNDFFAKCPKWTEADITNCLSQELNKEEEKYYVDSYRGCVGIVCNRRYVPGYWNVIIYPDNTSSTAITTIKKARPRIDNLMTVLGKCDRHRYSDVAIGVLPLDSSERIEYKTNLSI